MMRTNLMLKRAFSLTILAGLVSCQGKNEPTPNLQVSKGNNMAIVETETINLYQLLFPSNLRNGIATPAIKEALNTIKL